MDKYTDNADYKADVAHLPFPNESAGEIYASHVLEHFPHTKTLDVLKEWHRVLWDGGMLKLAVPDLAVIVGIIAEFGVSPWAIRLLYGDQEAESQYHYAAFNEALLRHYLTEAGFKDILRVDRFNHGLTDCSCLIVAGDIPKLKGVLVSLNLVAIKKEK